MQGMGNIKYFHLYLECDYIRVRPFAQNDRIPKNREAVRAALRRSNELTNI
jgi:hypothetical protein